MSVAFGHAVATLAYGLMAAGFIGIGLGFVSWVRAIRHGLPWWEGGLVWFMPSRQPPDAAPHMKAALRRWLAGAACFFAATVLNILADAMRANA